MLNMAAAAVYLAVIKHQPNNIGGGILTFYLVGTAWLTARRKDGETSRFDWVALLLPLAIGVGGWINGLEAMHSPTGAKYGVPAGMPIFMGSVCLLAAAGDVRMLLRAAPSVHSASPAISGACALACLSPPARFFWDRAVRYFLPLYSRVAYFLSRQSCHCYC